MVQIDIFEPCEDQFEKNSNSALISENSVHRFVISEDFPTRKNLIRSGSAIYILKSTNKLMCAPVPGWDRGDFLKAPQRYFFRSKVIENSFLAKNSFRPLGPKGENYFV